MNCLVENRGEVENAHKEALGASLKAFEEALRTEISGDSNKE